MAGPWKTVRVFISSTFRDMQAERDHLVRFMLSKLGNEWLKCRIRIVDRDLLGGITAGEINGETAPSLSIAPLDCPPRVSSQIGFFFGFGFLLASRGRLSKPAAIRATGVATRGAGPIGHGARSTLPSLPLRPSGCLVGRLRHFTPFSSHLGITNSGSVDSRTEFWQTVY